MQVKKGHGALARGNQLAAGSRAKDRMIAIKEQTIQSLQGTVQDLRNIVDMGAKWSGQGHGRVP